MSLEKPMSVIKRVCEDNRYLWFLWKDSLLSLLKHSISIEKSFKHPILYLTKEDKKILDERIIFLKEILQSKEHTSFKIIIKDKVASLFKLPIMIKEKLTDSDIISLLDILPLKWINSIYMKWIPVPWINNKPWDNTQKKSQPIKKDNTSIRDWSSPNNEWDIDYLQASWWVWFYKNKN